MKAFSKFGILSAVMLGLILSACTRAQDEKSQISLSIPLVSNKSANQSVSAQASTLNYLAINIGASDMPVIFCSWDVEENLTAGPCQFSQDPNTQAISVSLQDVQNGNNRIFQVLMVNSEGSGSALSFYYDDETVNLPSASSIPLTPTPIGGIQDSGHVKGRVLTGSNVGPSGLMKVQFSPGPGKPPMTIQQVEVYSGWFQSFTLETTGLDYIIDGVNLFGETMNKAKFVDRSVNSGYASRVIPAAPGSGEYDVFGFFSSSAGNLAGKTASASSCAAGDEYTNCLDSDSAFVGPFKGNAVGDMASIVGINPSTISWNFLPGMDSGRFDRVAIYAATVDLTTEQLNKVVMSKGFRCSEFANTVGVQFLGTVGIEAASQQLTATLASLPNPVRPLAICPQKGLLPPFTAAAVLPRLDNDGGCSNCKYLRLQFTSYAESNGDGYRIGKSGCYPIEARTYRGKGVPSSDHTLPIEMVLTNPAWGQFFSDAACISPVASPSLNIGPGFNYSSGNLYLKPNAAGAELQLAGAVSTDPSNGVISYQSQYNKIDVLNPITKVILPSGPILSDVCYQGIAKVGLPNNYQLPPPSGLTYDNLVGGTDVRFAPDAATCATSVSGSLSQMMGSNPIQSSFWFKRLTAGTVSVVASPTSFDSSTATAIAISSAVMTPVQVKVTVVSPPLRLGQCNEMNVEVVNKDGRVVPAPAAININLNPQSGSGFWSNSSDCNTVTNAISIPVQASGQFVYFYATDVGTLDLSGIAAEGLAPDASSPIIALPADVAQPWIKIASRPRFPRGSGSVGQHNFPVYVTLSTSVDPATLKCYFGSFYPSYDSNSWGDCSGRLSGTSVRFDSAELVPSGSSTTHILAVNGKRWTVLSLNKDRLFGSGAWNSVNCDTTVTSGIIDDVNTALGTHTNVCLAGMQFSKSSGTAESISMPAGKFLLGKIDPATSAPATKVVVAASAGSAGVNVGTLSSSVYISNIKFSLASGTGVRYGIRSTSGSSGSVVSFGNEFENFGASAGSITGISIEGLTPVTLDSKGDFFNLKSYLGGGVSKGIFMAPYGNFSNIQYSKFNFVSTDISNGTIALSISSPSSAPSSGMTISYSKFVGAGGAIRVMGQTISGSNNFQLTVDHTDVVTTDTAFSDAYGIYLQDNVGVSLVQNKVVNLVTARPAFKYYQGMPDGGYSGGTFINLTENIFRQGASASALEIGTASFDLTSGRQILLEANHFVKTGGGNSSPAIHTSTGGYDVYLVRNPASPGHGNNKVCGADPSNTWSIAYSGNTIGAHANQWSLPSIGSSMYGEGLCGN